MKRLIFWWVPRIIQHWIWLLFHKTVVQLIFNDPFGAEYIWSSGNIIGLTITHPKGKIK